MGGMGVRRLNGRGCVRRTAWQPEQTRKALRLCSAEQQGPAMPDRRTFAMIGRSERIRTSGPCVPNTVLYQAELHSGQGGAYSPRRAPSQGAVTTVRPHRARRDGGG
jgi:hypothetical protein